MFGGSWVETTKNYISIDIVDPLITVQCNFFILFWFLLKCLLLCVILALNIVFGSLYNDEVTLNPTEIVHILATATMFQLDGIIEKCREVMLETINPKVCGTKSFMPFPIFCAFMQTSLEYYNAACQYGDTKLKETCIQWFLVNLMTYYFGTNLITIKVIPIALMTKLVSHANLFVMKTEINVYIMLVQWMYLMIHQDALENVTLQDINNFFTSRTGRKLEACKH